MKKSNIIPCRLCGRPLDLTDGRTTLVCRRTPHCPGHITCFWRPAPKQWPAGLQLNTYVSYVRRTVLDRARELMDPRDRRAREILDRARTDHTVILEDTRSDTPTYIILSDNSDAAYRVSWWPDAGIWTCDCPDYVYRPLDNDSKCKHIRAIILMRLDSGLDVHIKELVA